MKYRENYIAYRIGGNIAMSQVGKVNSVDFINTGNTIAKINGMPIQPMGSKSVIGNAGEINTTAYKVAFDQTGISSPRNELWVVTKVYE